MTNISDQPNQKQELAGKVLSLLDEITKPDPRDAVTLYSPRTFPSIPALSNAGEFLEHDELKALFNLDKRASELVAKIFTLTTTDTGDIRIRALRQARAERPEDSDRLGSESDCRERWQDEVDSYKLALATSNLQALPLIKKVLGRAAEECESLFNAELALEKARHEGYGVAFSPAGCEILRALSHAQTALRRAATNATAPQGQSPVARLRELGVSFLA